MISGYQCPYCDTVAKSSQGYEKHAKAAHPARTWFLCPDCTTVARSEQGLKKHREAAHPSSANRR